MMILTFILVLGLSCSGCIVSAKNERNVETFSETGFGINSSSLWPCAQALADISAFPDEERYKLGSVVYNPAYFHLRPAFIAFPKSVEDVQRCLMCAYTYSVGCVVKSGGHSSAGYSTIDGKSNGAFVISLSDMDQVLLDEGSNSVVVQAGANWKSIYDKVDDTQYLIVGGMCSMVGVGGYTLGGGYSSLSRYFGLVIDNTISMTMVTANGSRVVTANAVNNTDLFWALRGGGGGNFGIVTDFTFRIHPHEAFSDGLVQFIYGELKFNASMSESALKTVFDLSPFPNQLYLDLVILPTKELEIAPIFLDTGAEDVDLNNLLKPLIHDAYNVTLNHYSSYYEVSKLVETKNGYTHVSPHPETAKGCIIGGESYSGAASSFLKFDIPETCVIAFMHLGGAIADISPQDTAYYYRDGVFEYYAPCLYRSDDEKTVVSTFEENLYHDLHSNGYCIGSYVNDMDKNLQNWQKEYYGKNYERLLEIKKLWNPLNEGTFHFAQEIGSNYKP